MEISTVFRSLQNGNRNYFGKLKLALKICGISLRGDEGEVYKIYSFFLIFCLNCLYGILKFLELFECDHFDANMIIYPLAVTLAFAKAVVLLRKRVQLGNLLDKLEQEPFIPNRQRGGEAEEKLMINCIWLINVQSILYWATSLATAIIAFALTVHKRIHGSSHNWQLPLDPLTIVNVTYSPNYEICLAYQTLSALVIEMHFSTFDLVIAGVLAFVTFQFKILQNNIRRLVELSYEEMLKDTGSTHLSEIHDSSGSNEIDASMVPWKYLKKYLAQAVSYHLAILRIVDEIEDLCSGVLLFAFLSTLGLLCLIVYQAAMVSLVDPLFWMYAGEVLMQCGQLFIVCFWGEQIMNESQEVARATYESNFVGADLRFQKSLILIIRRSQNPTVITAGKFSVIHLATFTWFLRTSYSAFTVLQNLKQ